MAKSRDTRIKAITALVLGSRLTHAHERYAVIFASRFTPVQHVTDSCQSTESCGKNTHVSHLLFAIRIEDAVTTSARVSALVDPWRRHGNHICAQLGT